jgi:L-ascorbate metabolism protein UlaG (beta-lactamase superfamily)
MKRTVAFLAAAVLLFALSSAAQGVAALAPAVAVVGSQSAAAPTITYIGHAELMIITAEGTVIYVDPTNMISYAYVHDADIILVSHEHGDHNTVDIVPQNSGCTVLRVKQTINKDGTYNTFTIGEVTVIPVPAANVNHSIQATNGFIIQFDGFTVYHAADTDKLDSMADLQQYNVDYAFFPIDGEFNMDATEAMECAVLVGAKHNTPIHWFGADPAKFTPENLLFMNYGDTITMEKTAGE